MLPPDSLCPDRPRTGPGLSYPETVNLAAVLVDTHIKEGNGGRTALVASSRNMSYAQLQNRVRSLAAGLKTAGCMPGDRVLLRLSNTPDLVAVWLATQMTGAIAVATPTMLRAGELAAIIDDARPRLIVTTPDWSGEVAQVVSDARDLSRMVFVGDNPRASEAAADSLDELAAGSKPFESAWPTAVDDNALIAYTVGADGRFTLALPR